MHVTRAVLAILLGTLAVHHPVFWPGTAGGAAIATGQDYRTTKGFVTAKANSTLTILAGNNRVLVVITNNTRVFGQRDSFTGIVPNDVVRVEERTEGSRLLADRIELTLFTF